MKSSVLHVAGWVLCVAIAASAGWADIIHLKNGQLDGEVIGKEGGQVRIRTSSGIVTAVNEGDIVSIEARRGPAEIYRSMAAKIASNDADGHFALAIWCRDHQLRDEMTGELLMALKINPDHEGVRAELGHVRTEDGWVSREAAMRARGNVLVDGRWLTKEEADRIENQEKNRKLVQWINGAVYKIHSAPNAVSKEWEEKLANFNEPGLAWKILALLEDREPAVRRSACASLARMKHNDGVRALVRHVLLDGDETVREAALGAAAQLDQARAREALYDMVDGLNAQAITSQGEQKAAKRIYYRVALSLGVVGDVNSVPYLIHILYPKVEIVQKPDAAGTPVGVYRSGGRGVDESGIPTNSVNVTMGGGSPVPVLPEGDRYYFNPAAEEALKKLTGQNLGVLPADWRKWWDAHGSELLRKADAETRVGKDKANRLLKEK